MDAPTATPHDLFCQAKEYERRGRLPDAANLYLKASMNGHLSAMVAYASHLVASDERAAFVWFRAAAERGDARAWAELGQLLARGRYFEVNAIDAARCWKRAAQMGDTAGKSALGLCYIRGFGVKQDPDKGVEIVRQVADVHNDVTAMNNLSWIYRYGKGVPKNLQQADYWQVRAKKQEKIVAHILSREHILFGRARSSRHKLRRDTDTHPTTSTPHNSQEQLQPLESPPPSETHTNPTAIEEHDLETRLQRVADHPNRPTSHSPEPKPYIEKHQSNTDLGHQAPQHLQHISTSHHLIENPSSPRQPAPAPHSPRPQTSRRPHSSAHNDPFPHEKQVRERPDPVLGAAVADLNFTEKSSRQPPFDTVLPFSKVNISSDADPHSQVHNEAVLRPSQNRPPSDPRLAAHHASNTESGSTTVIPGRGSAFVEESPDDQFITPEQSLDDNTSQGSLRQRRSVLATSSAAALLGGSAAIVGNTVSSFTPSKIPQETERAFEIPAESPAEVDDLPDDHVPDIVTQAVVESPVEFGDSIDPEARKPSIAEPIGLLHKPPVLAPGLQSRAEFFENGACPVVEEYSPSQPNMTKQPSYSLEGTSDAAVDVNQDLDEFEDNDIQQASGSVPNVVVEKAPTPTPDYPTDGHMFSGNSQATAVLVEGKSHTTTGVVDNSESTISELKDILALYPSNPLRADSQKPMLSFLSAVQNVPIANIEVFRFLQSENGFERVVVCMLSQIDDHCLQENGLHAMIRLLRTTPSSQREKLALLSYADCYRNVQGNPEAVVPKGSMDVDESSTGAIQAIILGMRRHSTVRRMQLAGCAALAEVAAISPSCRSVSYDYGAVNLVLAGLRHRSGPAAGTIHDVASRAVASFCSGKDNFTFKETFTSAGTVPELLSILQMWGHTEDLLSDLLTTVTKSCCTALRNITDGCAVASSQCVQSFAYHHLVRVMVLRRKDVSICTLVVAALTSITRNAGSISEKGLLDAKPLPEVLISMQQHSDNPLFIRKSLDFMESLGDFNSMKEEIVMAGGIPFAADIIQQAGTDSLLLERACGVVEKLCQSESKNQGMFASNNGVQALTALLRSHQGLPGVSEKALLALTSVCANNAKNQREATKVGAAQELVYVLGAYSSKHARVVAAAAGAIAALTLPKNAQSAQEFAQLKAPELLVRAMKRHADSVSVQENGSSAIACLCEADPRIISMLMKSGISTILVVSLQRFLHKQSAVIQIVRAMRAITNDANPEDSYRFKSRLLTDRSNESSLSEIFHTALSYHKKSLPDTAKVVVSICATINRLCMRSVAFKNEVGKDGIVEELKRLVVKTAEFRELGALQPVLATICTLVLESDDNKNRFHTVGGVEAILDVMQKWKSDTYVLEHCCAALRYSCNDHFGNCDEVKNHNGVRSILGVMELHPENVNVTLWCCLTLADLCKGDDELQSSPNVVQAIRKVISAMSMFLGNSRFLASACEFLRATSVDNIENQERIVRLGGRSAIVKALENHPADNTLTESGAYALLQVQDIADARNSSDGGPQLGLVKRLSRDLRRSGSNSSRSNRSSRGKLGRKSLSFTSRRRPTNDDDEAILVSPTAGDESTASRPSLMNISRSYKGLRKGRKSEVEIVEEIIEQRGAQDGYGDFDRAVHIGGESGDAQRQ